MGGQSSKHAHRNAGAFDVEEDELDDQPGCCGCFAKGVSSCLWCLVSRSTDAHKCNSFLCHFSLAE